MKNNRAPLEAAMVKYKDGQIFLLSKVSVSTSEQQWVSTTVKKTINLANTTAVKTSLLGVPGVVVQPEPPFTVADTLQLQQTQRFDITVLVVSVSDGREVKSDRQVIDVLLMDESEAEGKAAQLKCSLFFPFKEPIFSANKNQYCYTV